MNQNKKLNLLLPRLIFFTIYAILTVSHLPAIELVENPKITHSTEDITVTQLKIVKIIEPDFDENVFFTKPTSLAVSEKAIYFYDSMMKSVYMFDAQYRFKKKFMREGVGPGETNDQGLGFQKIYFHKNELYICDIYNNKIIVYSENGEHKRDIRFFNKDRGYFSFKPVFDDSGNLYALSDRNGIVDKYDSHMQLVHSYLKPQMNESFVVYRPDFENPEVNIPDWLWKRPKIGDVSYDLIGDDGLIIFMSRPSTVFIFKNDKLVKKFDIIMKEPVERLRKRLNRPSKFPGKKLPKVVRIIRMFDSFLVDEDDNRFFYLQSLDSKRQLLLYKFNLDGTLKKIISLSNPDLKSEILIKKNHLFYGQSVTKGNIYIYKEEK